MSAIVAAINFLAPCVAIAGLLWMAWLVDEWRNALCRRIETLEDGLATLKRAREADCDALYRRVWKLEKDKS